MYLFDDATQERTPQQTTRIYYFGSINTFDICTDEEEEDDIDIHPLQSY